MTDRFELGVRLLRLTEDTVGDAGEHRNTCVKPTVLKGWPSQRDPVNLIVSRLRSCSVAWKGRLRGDVEGVARGRRIYARYWWEIRHLGMRWPGRCEILDHDI
jgi:hypothetical protein